MARKTIANQKQLAKVLGISQPMVSIHVRRPDWPVAKRGPWSDQDVRAIRQWRRIALGPTPEVKHWHDATTGGGNAPGGAPGDAPGDASGGISGGGGTSGGTSGGGGDEEQPDYSNLSVAYRKTQIQLNHERMLHERLKRQINGGLYVPRDLLDGALGGLAAMFVQICDELEMSLPSRFASKRADQIERELTKLLDSCRRRICEKASYELAHLSKIRKPRKKRRGRPTVGS